MAVEPFGDIQWLHRCACYYWGDLDTHGFAILDRLRNYVPNICSVLMDNDTLIRHQALWVREERQVQVRELLNLLDDEQIVFSGILNNLWGNNIRLEQERVAWDFAQQKIQLAIEK